MNAMIAALAVVMSAMPAGCVELIAADSMSNVEEARTAVASTEAEWSALWKSHASDKALPKVDFAKRSVVAVFLGTRPSAGYRVEIIGVRPEGGGVVVEWS